MSFKRMSGFVDPITLGVLIALGGTALGLTQARVQDTPVAVQAKAQTPAPEAVSVVQSERAVAR